MKDSALDVIMQHLNFCIVPFILLNTRQANELRVFEELLK